MNTTTANAIAKSAATKAAKPQRRMARPAPDDAEPGAPPTVSPAIGQPEAKPAPTTKTSAVITLLERDTGATLAELIAATSWLPHTTRAALTGLRTKGHSIERGKRGDETFYSSVVAA